MAGIDFTNASHVAAVMQCAGGGALPTSIWDVAHTLRPLRELPAAYGGGEARTAAVMGAGAYWLHARPSRQFDVVAEVLAVQRRETHMEYFLDDGTGLIWARLAHRKVPCAEAPSAHQPGRGAVAAPSAAPSARSSRPAHRGFADDRAVRPLSAKARGKLPMQAPAPAPPAPAGPDELDVLRPRPPRDYLRVFGFDLHAPLHFTTHDPGVPVEYRPESMAPTPRARRRRPKAHASDEWVCVPAVAEDAVEVGDLLWVRAKIGRWRRQPMLQVDKPDDLRVVDLARQNAHVGAYYTASLPGGAYHRPLSEDEVSLPKYRSLGWDDDRGAHKLYKRMRLLRDSSPEDGAWDPFERQQQNYEAKRRRLLELDRSPTPEAAPAQERADPVPRYAASPTFEQRQRAYIKALLEDGDEQPQGAVQVRISDAPARPLTRAQEAFKARFDGDTSSARSGPAESGPRPRTKASGLTEFTATVLAREEAHYGDADRTLDPQATPRGKRMRADGSPTPQARRKHKKCLVPPDELAPKHLSVDTIGLYVLEWIQTHCAGRGQPPAWTVRYLRRAARLQAVVFRVIAAQLARRDQPSQEGFHKKSKRLFTYVVRNLWKSGRIVPAAAGTHATAPSDGRTHPRRQARLWTRTESWGTTAEEWLSAGGEVDAPPSSGAYARIDAAPSIVGSASEAEEDELDVSEPEAQEEAYQLVTPALIMAKLQPLLQHVALDRLNDAAHVRDLLTRTNEECQHVTVEDVRQALAKACGTHQVDRADRVDRNAYAQAR